MEKNNLDKSLAAKDEEKRLQAVIDGKTYEWKQQEFEIHMAKLFRIEKKLKEEVHKLETENEDLRQKLDAVVTRNQVLSEEKAAICAKGSLDVKVLQEHSEKWRQLHELCVEKLHLISSCKLSVDNKAQTSHTEREDFTDEVQHIIQRIEEAKEKDYVIWYNKLQEDIVNALQLLDAEYSRFESSLLKHNEKLDLVINKLLEDLRVPFSKQVPYDETSNETITTHKAQKLVEEVTLLNTDLKEQYLQLRLQLEHQQEELRRKLEILRPSSDTSPGSEKVLEAEKELRKENVLLEQQTTCLLSQNPQNLRELWDELKDENCKLKEQIGKLLEHIKQEENIEITENEVAELNNHMRKTVGCSDKGVMTYLTMFTSVKKREDQMKMELNEEDRIEHKIERNVQEQETMTEPMICKQSPHHSQELLFELRDENTKLQKQIDLLVEHIKDKEDVINKETMTESGTWTMQPSDELLMENLKLKQQIILLTESTRQNNVIEKETMTEPLTYELPEQYRDLLDKLKIENMKLEEQVHLFEVRLKEKEATEDRGIMTDAMEWKEEQICNDEDDKLKADVLLLKNKIKQHNKDSRDAGTGFGPLLEKDESEVDGASWYIPKLCTAAGSERYSTNRVSLVKDQNLQETFNENSTDQKIMAVENLLAENRALKGQLEAVRLELEDFHSKTVTRPLKTGSRNVQTMTDPDIELVSISMENAALQAQLQQLSKECKKKREDLERTLVLLKESREASSLLLEEAWDANAHENTLLKKELEEMKRKFKHQEQEIFKSRIVTTKEHPAKITELCNLLDHLRKENMELQAQLKETLTEKEGTEDTVYGCHSLQQNQETLKGHSVDNFDGRIVTNKNFDSLTHILSMGCSVSEEAQQKKALGMKAGNDETVDVMQSQAGTVFAVSNIPTTNQDEAKVSFRTNDRCESELSFSDISLLNKAKQNSPNSKCKHKIPVNAIRKEQELQNIHSVKSQICKYPGSPVHYTDIERKGDEIGCSLLTTNSQNPSVFSNGKIKSEDIVPECFRDQAQGDCVTSALGPVKHQKMYKDYSSCNSEVFPDMKCCQNLTSCGLSSESTNSDLELVSQEPVCIASFRPCRDAATNTTPSVQNLELQRELQLEKDKCRKYQQNMKKLKSDVQMLKNKLGESRKQGKIESNLALKQNNTNNNSFLTDIQSPSHYSPNMAEFQRQVAELEQKVQEENSMRFSLEVQVNKMRYELQEKLQLEKELNILRNRLEKDFVSRYELEHLRNSYEVALSRAKYEAEMAARDDLNEKLCQINTFIEKEVQEQTRLSQLRNSNEAQMKQDFQETRLKLLSELAKVQASLQAKGEEEKELREKCEKLTKECEKKQEIRRKKLIEKSYSVNLAPNSNLKEKELNSKGYMLRSPMHRSNPVQPMINPISSPAVAVTTHVADAWQTEHPFSHILRRELERSIRKHTRTDSLTEHPSSSSPQTASEEHLELLKKKYFLH